MLNMRESLMKWPWSLIFGTDFVIAPDKSEKRDTKEQPFPCKHGGLFFVFRLFFIRIISIISRSKDF